MVSVNFYGKVIDEGTGENKRRKWVDAQVSYYRVDNVQWNSKSIFLRVKITQKQFTKINSHFRKYWPCHTIAQFPDMETMLSTQCVYGLPNHLIASIWNFVSKN